MSRGTGGGTVPARRRSPRFAPRGRRVPAALALTALAIVALAPGCAVTPGLSNGSVSVCYRAIPVGRSAVHDQHAHLVGVHRVSVDAVRNDLPVAVREILATENDTAVCAMAFEGTFAPGQVAAAPAGEQGRYALVLVSSRRLHLLDAFVLAHLPEEFGGRQL